MDFIGVLKLHSQVQESLTTDNVFTVEQRGTYLQLGTVRKSRTVTTTIQEPKTLFGLQLQLSLVGSCIFPGTTKEQLCTYTPGLVTDINSIEPNFLVPTRINQTSNVGDIVTPESLAVMTLPGFQQGANGQQLGVDLFFPNAGAIPGNTQTNQTLVTRRDEIENIPAIAFSGLRQTVQANDEQAMITRTLRGFVFVVDDKNTLINSILQFLLLLLPDLELRLNGSENKVNDNINQNLFKSVNNTRIPADSLTSYQIGIGNAKTPNQNITSIDQVPGGMFNSIWVGISPVTKATSTNNIKYQLTGNGQVIQAGGEGGIGSNIQFTSIVNNNIFSTANLDQFYAQIYLTILKQNAYLVNTNKFQEITSYYPHISFTGNMTNNNQIWRYYTGLILGNTIAGYLGSDITNSYGNDRSWSSNFGMIGYFNPDRYNYSQLWGNLAKTFFLGEEANLVLLTGLNWVLDQQTTAGDAVVISQVSSVRTGGNINWGIFSAGLTYFIGGILPNSVDNELLIDMAIQLTPFFKISGYYTPINQNTSRSPYGASLQIKLGDQNDSPTLSASWVNQDYLYGQNQFGQEISSEENVFAIIVRVSH